MTQKLEQILNIIDNFTQDGICVISIHDLGYPKTPDSINPALKDLETLQDLEKITSFERVSSRNVKIIK